MLKHASGGLGAIPTNGQIRGNISANGPRSIHLRPQQPLNIASLNGNGGHLHSTSVTAATTTPSVLNTSLPIHGNGKGSGAALTNGNGSANANGGCGGVAMIGGQRSPKTIPSSAASHPPPPNNSSLHSQAQGQTPTSAISTAEAPATMTTTVTATSAVSVTPPNPVLNGTVGNNLHTYTNQHIALASSVPGGAVKIGAHNGNSNASFYHQLQHPQQPANHVPIHSGYPTSTSGGHAPNLSVVHQMPNHHHHHQLHTSHQQPHLPPRLPPPLPPATAFGNSAHQLNPHYTSGVVINQSKHGPGPREALTSLGLLCLLSLLLALLSLIFLLKISPNSREEAHSRTAPEDFIIVYDVTLALCALSLSLNLCCLLVCAIQFLFAVKLVRSPMFDGRDNRYLEKSGTSRICAVGGFFISIPIFLTGIILYTFNHFHSTPAIITSVLIGLGIVFCGGAMVHNVFLWQKEKTISYRSLPLFSNAAMRSSPNNGSCIGSNGGAAGVTTGLHYLPSPPNTTSASLPVHLVASASSVCPITPPAQFLTHQGPTTPHHLLNFNHHHSSANASLILQPSTVTPVSPNHSHTSFNPLTTLSSTFLMRPSTTTPPTPKSPLIANGCLAGLNAATITAGMAGGAAGREASGSISPALPPITNNLDLSVLTNASLHELSTLV